MLKIRKANIDPKLRTALERYGVPVIQRMVSDRVSLRDNEGVVDVEANRVAIMVWLTEEHDRADRKANVSLAMEAGILILVLLEVVHILTHW
jgi:hypothetical protein